MRSTATQPAPGAANAERQSHEHASPEPARPMPLLRATGTRPRRPWTNVGRFSLRAILSENSEIAAHCEAHLRCAIRSIIPD